MKKLKLLNSFLLIACLSLAGCSGTHRFYKGDQLRPEQVAHLTNKGDKHLRLLAVDGKYGPHGKIFGFSSRWDNFFDVEILPGKYDLTLLLFSYVSKCTVRAEPVSMELKVEPGETYYFVARVDVIQATYKVEIVNGTKRSTVLTEGPFSTRVFPSAAAYGGRPLTPEEMNAIIQRTLPPLDPPHHPHRR